jgi:hypothetical protein
MKPMSRGEDQVEVKKEPQDEATVFLDLGGDILWPADAASDRKFGAPVDISLLPLSGATQAIMRELSQALQAAAETGAEISEPELENINELLHVVHERARNELSRSHILVDDLIYSDLKLARSGG